MLPYAELLHDILYSGNSVKCQKCGITVPIVGKLTSRSDRIAALQRQIKWIEAQPLLH
jgi:hypothetical protein